MNNFIFLWIGIILVICIGSTVFLFFKLRKLQNRVEVEMSELEKELLDEVKFVGNLEKTESGRKLKEMLLIEQPEYFNPLKNSNARQSNLFSTNFLKTSLIVAGISGLLFLFIWNFPKLPNDPILQNLLATSIPSLLTIAGIIFLMQGMVTIKKPIVIAVNNTSRKFAIILGIILIGLGIALYIIPVK